MVQRLFECLGFSWKNFGNIPEKRLNLLTKLIAEAASLANLSLLQLFTDVLQKPMLIGALQLISPLIWLSQINREISDL